MTEEYIIYADILFLLNFIIDFACLFITSRLLNLKMSVPRLSLGSAFGGIYAVGAVYLNFSLWYLSLPCHIASALFMCLLSFGKADIKSFLKRSAVFILSSACVGGIVTAIFALSGRYYISGSGLYAEISPIFLMITAALSVVLTYLYGLSCRKRLKFAVCDINVFSGSTKTSLSLLCDSGCLATDPLSGLPVIIVGSEKLTFKPELNRLIPINTASGTGMLMGFIPDRIVLKRYGKRDRNIHAVIAVDSENNDFSGLDGIINSALAI